jgi:hypothetical protein
VTDILKKLAPHVRALGFRGSGQTYRKTDGDFVFIINFQGSRSADTFYINLAAQPVFIPAEGDADLAKLKEYECMLRTRVGRDWPRQMSDAALAALVAELTSAQAAFFGHAQTLRASLAVDPPEELVRKFCSGTTAAAATLALARAAAKLGHTDAARNLVDHGLDLAGDTAIGLRAQLRRVLDASSE